MYQVICRNSPQYLCISLQRPRQNQFRPWCDTWCLEPASHEGAVLRPLVVWVRMKHLASHSNVQDAQMLSNAHSSSRLCTYYI